MLILLWVWDEVTFDQYFSKYDNLYEVYVNASIDKGIVTGESVPYALKDALQPRDARHAVEDKGIAGRRVRVGTHRQRDLMAARRERVARSHRLDAVGALQWEANVGEIQDSHGVPGPRLVTKADGIEATIVNGEVAVVRGELTGARSGRVIRGA